MLFGTQKRLLLHGKDLNVCYNETNITFVKRYEYIGNKLDYNLVMHSNFEKAHKHASDRMRLLYGVQNFLTTDAATKIFHMMILPILTYSGPVNPTYTTIHKDRLASLNRRAKQVTTNDNLKDVYQEIQRQNCILVKKFLLTLSLRNQFVAYMHIL